MFISIDGLDGAGKSTQIQRLVRWLEAEGLDVITLRDPGSTPFGETLRELLLSHHQMPICVEAEMLVYMAARAQLVRERIQPALAEGQAVVCDRFLLANVVYQGYAGGMDPDAIWEVGRIAVGDCLPELTFFLDLEVDVAMRRLPQVKDRLESRSAEYFHAVRQGFLREAERGQLPIEVLDASQPVEQIAIQIQTRVQQVRDRQLT